MSANRGAFLEDVTWIEAERLLTRDAIVVVPIGAAAKEHGPHLKLDNDARIASYLAARVAACRDVVIAPNVAYHFYPAFAEYPGSTSLRLETARDLVVDICASLARFGPRRFYAINTGVSTIRALALSRDVLAAEDVIFRFTDLPAALAAIEREVSEQEAGTHADEIETSMMLCIAPDRVAMANAVKDIHPKKAGGLTRDPNGAATYSPSGVYGDATLATRAKGERVIEALVRAILADIDALQNA